MIRSAKSSAVITVLTIVMVTMFMLFAGSSASHAVASVAKPKISSLNCVISKSFTVKSNKNSDVNGYQVRYSLSKTFAKMKTISCTGTKLSKTIKKLKAGKIYYVKIRAYKTVNGKKVFSKWSDKKSVKVYLGTARYTWHVTTKLYSSRSFSASSIKAWFDTKLRVISTVKTTAKGKWQKVRLGNKTKNYYLWTPKGRTNLVKQRAKSRTYTKSSYTRYQNQVIKKAMPYLQYNTAYDFDKKESDGVKRNGRYTFHCSGFATFITNKVMTSYAAPYNISANMAELWDTTFILNEGMTGQMKAVKVCGSTLDVSKLKAGDILFFKMSGSSVDHCAIYLGNSNFIQSTKTCKDAYFENGKDSNGGVCIAPLRDVYKETFAGAKRYLPAQVKTAGKTLIAKKAVSLYPTRKCTSGTQANDKLPVNSQATLLFTYKIGKNENAYVKCGDKKGYVFNYETCFDPVTQ